VSIESAKAGDVIYCDPPYLGRYADYYNNWTEEHEATLARALSITPAKFVMSSWHHNDYRENIAIPKYWSSFNILTRDHFYHSGAKEENRKPIVEALICNFDLAGFDLHNHGIISKPEQLMLLEPQTPYVA
jgi:DNA adenine methylase